MTLRVAFDLDGTLADMRSALKEIEARLFGTGMGHPARTEPAVGHDAGAGDPDGTGEDSIAAEMKTEGLTLRQQRQVWQAVAEVENFWEGFDEIEAGAVQTIADHAASRDWEVIFLTRRPVTAGRTSQEQTQRWLQARGVPLPSVFVVTGSRGKIAEALGLHAVVDDLPENCVDVVADSRARAILIRRDPSARVAVNAKRLGITVVTSIAEALTVLVDLEQRKDHPTVADRLKRAVGLR
jgi:phosphoserine phosphatase